ncbi:hypothetical protein HZI73_22450 [Vallitalea pronyensis]|uniref:Uncharacterized protein n=1 Tax=Vallitalea pronyensis TaxID=1348613 RepID=A0A8J8MNX1_9FIRM|nr:hypothetical protein [Vallitalea pronyensis]QUI24891.1 hypothetical protein HZI73_22450 [Vallitalea pronyensis]
MNLENSIKDVITKKLEDGTIEQLVSEQLEKGVVNALDNLFRSYGDVTKTIEEKVKSVMVPYLESYDYSNYIAKLDNVLVEVLKNSALDNKKLLTNFKDLMTGSEDKTIKMSSLWEKWKDFVANNVNTDDLGVDYDDDVSYEMVDVSFDIEYDTDRNWSSFEHATLVFECDQDEEMNFTIKLHRFSEFRKGGWTIDYNTAPNIKTLRHLNSFEILMMKLNQAYTKLEIDMECDNDEVQPEAVPEASFS